MKKPIVYFIVGPTACGKTAAAVELALKMQPAEVISADAIQIYRGLDKGSAKPTNDEKKGIKHHMIDIVDYTNDGYNVAKFKEDASKRIEMMCKSAITPIVAGGTGLYVNSLIFPLNFTTIEPNADIRKRLMEEENTNPGVLYNRLNELDSVAGARLHPNDTKRIIRALEIYESSGNTMTSYGGDFSNNRCIEIPYEPVIAGITMERSKLYDKINDRVDQMIRSGLENEAFGLFKGADGHKLPSLQAIGYKQFGAYFNGECSHEETIETIKRETRRFAKRQLSWFKRDERIRWFNADCYDNVNEMHKHIYEYFMTARRCYDW